MNSMKIKLFFFVKMRNRARSILFHFRSASLQG